jgi:hypothetical protein
MSGNRALAIAFVTGLVLSCSSKDDAPASVDAGKGAPKGVSAAFRKTLANPAPAELQEGERLYYEETFGTEVDRSWPPAEWLVKLWKSDEAKWGKQFSKFGWIVDPGDDLPVGLKRGSTDGTLVHETCATCHVTVLDDGRVWSGMPAQHLAWAQFRLALNDAWMAAGYPSLMSPAAIAKSKLIQQPGSSNAENASDLHVVQADFPLYVNLGLRKNLGYTGAGRDVRSQCFLSILTFGAGDSVPFPGDDVTGPLVDYLSWTRTPKPLAVDADAAARGQKVFTAEKCGSCHHVDDLSVDRVAQWFAGPELRPGDSPDHGEGTIATDKNFFDLTGSDADPDAGGGPGPGLDKLLRFIIEHRLQVVGTDGYAVTDLHGLFASAPYLHNGSVPTLDDLLKPPAERPVTFTRDGYTIDTTKDGMTNVGHAFGTTLPSTDKADLIAYLKSL